MTVPYLFLYPTSIWSIFVPYPFCICYIHVPAHKRVPCQVTCEWSWKQWPDGSLGLGLPCTYICTTTNKGLPFRSQFLAYAWPFDKLLIPLKFSQKLERKQTQLFMVKIEFSIQFSIKSTVTYTVETSYFQFLKGSQGKLHVVLFSIALYN